MIIRTVVIFLFFFPWFNAYSQANGQYKHQLTFIGDNDVLALKKTDRYYTNGLFVQYSILRKSKGRNVIKHIDEWEAGQQIFNAFRRQVNFLNEIDRPVAGYLYGKYSKAKFLSGNRLLKIGVSIGTIGRASLAQNLMQVFHPLLKINSRYWNWIYHYQLKDEPGINLHGRYAFSVIKEPANSFQVSPETNVNVGTSFVNVSQSAVIQLGKLNAMHEGAYWHARLNSGDNNIKKEFFLFFQPEVMYQLYNATIQGGLFRSDKGITAGSPKPFVLSNSIGVMFSHGRYIASGQYVLQSREVKAQKDTHVYGRIKVSYLLK